MYYLETSSDPCDAIPTKKIPKEFHSVAQDIYDLEKMFAECEQIHFNTDSKIIRIISVTRVNGILHRLPLLTIGEYERFSLEKYYTEKREDSHYFFKYGQLMRDIHASLETSLPTIDSRVNQIIIKRVMDRIKRKLLGLKFKSYEPLFPGQKDPWAA